MTIKLGSDEREHMTAPMGQIDMSIIDTTSGASSAWAAPIDLGPGLYRAWARQEYRRCPAARQHMLSAARRYTRDTPIVGPYADDARAILEAMTSAPAMTARAA